MVQSLRELRPLLALVAVNGAGDGALLPLLPTMRADLGLTGLQVAALLAATTVVVLVTSMPIGLLAGRASAGLLLVVVALLLPVSLLAMSLAPGFAALLAARMLFGLSFSVLWVVAPAWAATTHGTAGTGRLLAWSGAGWLAGPLLAGVVADMAGWRVALALAGAATLPVVPMVLGLRRSAAPVTAPTRLVPALDVLRRRRPVRLVVAASVVLGTVTGVTGLLPAYVLAGNGLSAAAIGVAMGLAAVVWILAAGATGRAGLDADASTTVGWVLIALALVWLLPATSLSSVAVLGFLLLSAACRSTLNTLVFAAAGRAAGDVSAPAVVAMMNLGWAVAALIAPFVAGAAESDGGIRVVFAATAATAAGVAWATLRPGRERAALA